MTHSLRLTLASFYMLCGLLACGGRTGAPTAPPKGPARLASPMELVPAETSLLVTAPSAVWLAEAAGWDQLRKRQASLFEQPRAALTQLFGANLLDLGEWKTIGIAVDQPIAMAWTTPPTFMFLLPLTDSAAFRAAVSKAGEQAGFPSVTDAPEAIVLAGRELAVVVQHDMAIVVLSLDATALQFASRLVAVTPQTSMQPDPEVRAAWQATGAGKGLEVTFRPGSIVTYVKNEKSSLDRQIAETRTESSKARAEIQARTDLSAEDKQANLDFVDLQTRELDETQQQLDERYKSELAAAQATAGGVHVATARLVPNGSTLGISGKVRLVPNGMMRGLLAPGAELARKAFGLGGDLGVVAGASTIPARASQLVVTLLPQFGVSPESLKAADSRIPGLLGGSVAGAMQKVWDGRVVAGLGVPHEESVERGVALGLASAPLWSLAWSTLATLLPRDISKTQQGYVIADPKSPSQVSTSDGWGVISSHKAAATTWTKELELVPADASALFAFDWRFLLLSRVWRFPAPSAEQEPATRGRVSKELADKRKELEAIDKQLAVAQEEHYKNERALAGNSGALLGRVVFWAQANDDSWTLGGVHTFGAASFGDVIAEMIDLARTPAFEAASQRVSDGYQRRNELLMEIESMTAPAKNEELTPTGKNPVKRKSSKAGKQEFVVPGPE